MKKYFYNLSIIFLIVLTAHLNFVNAQDGIIDSTFGQNGIVITEVSNYDDNIRQIILQPDGRIIAVGITYKENWNETSDIALVRYQTDGSLDTSFNHNGIVTKSIGTELDDAKAVAIQTDGKILVAGHTDKNELSDFLLLRFQSDGILDTTFGSNGIVITEIGNYDDWGASLALQPDGRIIVGGTSNSGSSFDFALSRFNINGELDSTFGVYGKVLTDFGDTDYGYDIALNSEGKIILGGISNANGNYDFALSCYFQYGKIDSTFGLNGKVLTNIGEKHDWFNEISIQSDGKIVATGMTNDDFALVRYNSNGSLDTTFGINGKVLTDLDSDEDWSKSLVIQSDGKIIIVGETYTYESTNYDIVLIRYDTNGTIDSTFGNDGIILTDFDGNDDFGQSIVLDQEDNIIVGGNSHNGISDNFILVKYINKSIPITSYSQDKINSTYLLSQNYPNPFNPTTKIRYALPENLFVKLRIYDVLGNLVLDAVDGNMSAGYYEFTFDASELSSGLYLYRIETEKFVDTKKMILLR